MQTPLLQRHGNIANRISRVCHSYNAFAYVQSMTERKGEMAILASYEE